jgi:hypothetical protein
VDCVGAIVVYDPDGLVDGQREAAGIAWRWRSSRCGPCANYLEELAIELEAIGASGRKECKLWAYPSL